VHGPVVRAHGQGAAVGAVLDGVQGAGAHLHRPADGTFFARQED
jgi:hypothetical protein